MRGTENPHCSKQTMQSRFFFFFLSPITLCWSLFTHSCRRRAGEGEGGSKGTDEHPHDRGISKLWCAHVCPFLVRKYSGKVADM